MRNDPTGRALQLLSLLQTHRLWRGAELAERLEVTERTVRRGRWPQPGRCIQESLRWLDVEASALPPPNGRHSVIG